MQRLMNTFSWIFAVSFLGMTSCTIETAQPIKSQTLVIASDFLYAEDTLFFKSFVEKNDIRLVIRHLSTDQIIDEVQEKGYNSGIDMVLAQNMQTPIKLNKSGVLQDMIEQTTAIKSQNIYISYKHNFIGIGLDPFVFKYTWDSLREIQYYQDLSRYPTYHTLSESDKLSFLSPIRKERKRAKTYEWIKKWVNQTALRPLNGPWNDSAQVVLCKYSQLETFKDSIWENYAVDYFYPNENRAGVYFDVVNLSIVHQAEHFPVAQKFLAHCQNSGYNATLNEELNRFPIYDYLKARTEGPKFYPAHIDELLQYHDILERMLQTLN